MSTPLVIIDGETVRRLAPYPDLIEWMREAMTATSAGDAELPLRWPLRLPADFGAVGIMPGYLGGDVQSAGVKLVSLAPPHRRKGSSHLGMTVLYDADGLVPEAILCGATVTAIRTAAASAMATDALAQKNARSLAILGAGEQAESHLEAMQCVRDFDDIRVWARQKEKAEAFVSERRGGVSGAMRAAASVREAVSGADVICAVTSAKEPILFGADIDPGAHVNLVGSSFREASEADIELVRRSAFYVDYRPSTMAQAGEFLAAMEAGAVSEDHIRGEIGEVLSGAREGRRGDDEITVYKSLGVASQDIITARRVFERAKTAGLGVTASI